MKAQAVEAQLAGTTQELQKLRIEKQELGKLLHQAQLDRASLAGQVSSSCLLRSDSAGYVIAITSWGSGLADSAQRCCSLHMHKQAQQSKP